MRISQVCSPATISTNNGAQCRKNTNFQAKLSLSREASKTLAEKASEFGIAANNGVRDTIAYLRGNQFASYFDDNINYLARKIEPINPEDFPIVFDLSKDYKNFLKNGGKRQDLEKDIQYYGDQADKMFELCPNGKNSDSKDAYRMIFNLNYSMLPVQMERLYYAVKEYLSFWNR